MSEDRWSLGPPSTVPRVRARRLLRFLAKHSCHQTLPCNWASSDGDFLSTGWLGLVLRGRSDDRSRQERHAASTGLEVLRKFEASSPTSSRCNHRVRMNLHPTHYLFASDFDQTLSFHDSGHVLADLLG